MKKFLLFLSMLTLCLLLVGCSKDSGGQGADTSATGADGEHVHTWGEPEIIEEADCVYDGESIRECTECGLRETVVIPATGHDVEGYSYTENPTFLKSGKKQGTCTNCGKKIREDAEAFKKEYKTVSANLSSVGNVYFNGYWKDGSVAGVSGATTSLLGSEVVAKVTGASTVTYSFRLADGEKTATVAYSLDGKNWTRQELTENASVTVSVPAEETVVRVMYVGAEEGQTICLTSVTSDGAVAPCVKDGKVALTVSDKVDSVEKDALTLASENLGYTSWRISANGLGYANFGEILDEYISATGKTVATPDYIMLDLGANDADVSSSEFTSAVSETVAKLIELYPDVDIYFVIPMNGAKTAQLESVSTAHGIVSIIETAEWSVSDASASADKLSEFLVNTYGESVYFSGLYDSYNDPETPVFPDNKEEEPKYGPLYPMN